MKSHPRFKKNSWPPDSFDTMPDSVTRKTSQRTVFLALGSNLGDRAANLQSAVNLLEAMGLPVCALSGIHETEPVGCRSPEWFLNQVVAVTSQQAAGDILARSQRIEGELGRTDGRRGSPRPIDVDILLVGREIIRTPDLILPHPRLHLRRFVLTPLAEIAAQVEHPVLGQTVARLLENCSDQAAVRPWKRDSHDSLPGRRRERYDSGRSAGPPHRLDRGHSIP